MDEGEFDRLTEVFMPDVEHDVSALGGENPLADRHDPSGADGEAQVDAAV